MNFHGCMVMPTLANRRFASKKATSARVLKAFATAFHGVGQAASAANLNAYGD
jgi:hypothetical protein